MASCSRDLINYSILYHKITGSAFARSYEHVDLVYLGFIHTDHSAEQL
uniref:Uncharacterized protein n=1 Tax=Arundo donax TaxID=35708 RepID=A0A0A9EWE1_ARUDO